MIGVGRLQLLKVFSKEITEVFYFSVPCYSLPSNQLRLILCNLLWTGARDVVKRMRKVNSSVSRYLNVLVTQRGDFPTSFYLLHELSLMHLFSKVALEELQVQ